MHLYEEASRCLFCADAPCSKACKHADPARALRAIRFGNESLAGKWLENASEAELEAAEQACDINARSRRLACKLAEE